MALTPSELSSLIIAEDVIIYNTLAASAFVFWDYFITLEEEVNLIWRSKWTVVNLLFYLIRYTILSIRIFQLMIYTNISNVIHPTFSMCKAWVWYEAIPGHLVYACVDAVLMMRVIAFYGKNIYVTAGLLTYYISMHVASITLLVISIPKFLVLPNTLPPSLHVSACLVLGAPKLFLNYWILGLALESVLFMLLIIRYIQTNQGRISRPHILVVFVRDGAWVFAVMFGVMLWSAVSFQLTPQKGDIALTWVLSVLGVGGSRLILNLRAAASEARKPVDAAVELRSLKQHTTFSSGYTTFIRNRTKSISSTRK